MEKSTVLAPAAEARMHRSRSPARDRRLPMIADATLAVLSVVAATIHLLVVPEHLDEYVPFGVFFVVIGIAQAGWALLMGTIPGRGLLATGLVGNAAIILIWAVTRTVGLPIGPEPWAPEPVGAWDVLSTGCEVLIVTGLLVLFPLVTRFARPAGGDHNVHARGWGSDEVEDRDG